MGMAPLTELELSEQLAGRLNCSQAEALQDLNELVRHIQAETASLSPVTLEGVGSLSKNNGELQFTIDKNFINTLNAQYDGSELVVLEQPTGRRYTQEKLVDSDKIVKDALEDENSTQENMDFAPPPHPEDETPKEPESDNRKDDSLTKDGSLTVDNSETTPNLPGSDSSDAEGLAPIRTMKLVKSEREETVLDERAMLTAAAFLARYEDNPHSDQAADALFWAAENYVDAGLSERASSLFAMFLRDFPQHGQAPAARDALAGRDIPALIASLDDNPAPLPVKDELVSETPESDVSENIDPVVESFTDDEDVETSFIPSGISEEASFSPEITPLNSEIADEEASFMPPNDDLVSTSPAEITIDSSEKVEDVYAPPAEAEEAITPEPEAEPMYEEDLDYTPDLQLDSDESMEWTVDDDPILKGIAPEKDEVKASSPLRLTFMLLLVIVVGILGVLGYERFFGENATATTSTTGNQGQQQAQNTVTAENNNNNSDPNSNQQVPPVAQQSPPEEAVQQQQQNLQTEQQPTTPVQQQTTPTNHPLIGRGTFNKSQGGFTWVLTGRPQRSAAENIANGVRNSGYRVDIIEGTSNGAPYYRIGVGQFATRAEALQMKGQLPAIVPTDTWLFVIQ